MLLLNKMDKVMMCSSTPVMENDIKGKMELEIGKMGPDIPTLDKVVVICISFNKC